ncbi:MAG: ABC transporter permease [Thermomicrobiales bacterium]|nr:ABC transporter permease [Thermomicrobiales bacterium]
MAQTTAEPNAPQSLASAADPLRNVKKQRSLWGDAWRQFRRHKPAMVGLSILIFFVLLCYVGIYIWTLPHNSPYVYESNVAIGGTSTYMDLTTFEDKTQFHPLGTDEMGQDMLARIIFGGRISLSVGIMAALISIAFGTAIGAAAGFYGGFVDSLLMRITDLFISLPTLPLLLLITFLFKNSVNSWADDVFGSPYVGTFLLIVGVISMLAWMPTARLVRASFMSTKEKEFVEAAKSIGSNELSLIVKQILPNVLSPIIVAATLQVGSSIITESSLSFLGLGFPYDVPTWGAMLFNAKDQMQFNPKLALLPGTMIFLTVLAINFIGDGLRDALDPRKTH